MPPLLQRPLGYQKIKLPGLGAWVNALRGGAYAQGVGQFRKGDCYCCLGVLSAIQGRLEEHRSEGSESWGEGVLAADNPLYPILRSDGRLPENVAVLIGDDNHGDLISLNDHAGFTFEQIANLLEELYEEGPAACPT